MRRLTLSKTQTCKMTFNVLGYRGLTQCLILKLDKPGLKPLAIPGLAPGEFIIKPVTNKFTFKQDPKHFGVGVRRFMFPVEHAAAMSEFKVLLSPNPHTRARTCTHHTKCTLTLQAQGATLDRVVLDLR